MTIELACPLSGVCPRCKRDTTIYLITDPGPNMAYGNLCASCWDRIAWEE